MEKATSEKNKGKFREAVYKTVSLIPRGKVMSYGGVALVLGFPRAARAVGWVLHFLPDDTKVPWWRVVNRQGFVSTSCAEHTAFHQMSLLKREGIILQGRRITKPNNYWFWPSESRLKENRLSAEVIDRISKKIRAAKGLN